MNKQKIWQIAFLNSFLTALYIALVAIFLNYANQLFGPADSVFGSMAVLVLLVLSAAIVGTLVLGRPLMFFLDGQKKVAVQVLLYTLGLLFFIFIVLVSILALS